MKIAMILLALARSFAPVTRREWFEAMAWELQHVPERERIPFTFGCLITSIQQRIQTMTHLPPLRIIPGLLAAAFLSVLCLGNGVAFISDAPVIGALLLSAAVLWLGVYSVVSAQENERLAKLAIAGIAFYGAIGLASLAGLPAFSGNAAMFGALSIEGIALCAAALVISRIPFFWAQAETNTPENFG